MPQLTRDGIRLTYEEAGSGGPALLFVHGFGGSAQHFAPQLEHFARSRRVVALDRRGHGRSDKPEGPYTIPAIAEEVIWSLGELGLHKPVLVVHSMGAIGFEVARQAPAAISALITLDAPLFAPPPAQQAFRDLLEGLASPGYRDVIDATCERLIFLPTDDKLRRTQLHAAMLETPQHVLVDTWKHFLAYDLLPAAQRLELPLLCVNSVMPCDEAQLRNACPQVVFGRSVGAGHFHQLEVPAQINGMIERFVAIGLAGR